MMVIRTFVAVLIAEDLREKVAQVQGEVKKLAPDVKWVAPENFHVTLKFLGNVREDQIGRITKAVEEAVRSLAPFDISISGMGAFPSPARARVVWTGIEAGRDEMVALAKTVDASLARLGFEKESKPFKAHITIGRVREGRSPGRLAEGIEKTDASDLGTQRVESVAVMASELGREGPAYTPLSVTKLTGDA